MKKLLAASLMAVSSWAAAQSFNGTIDFLLYTAAKDTAHNVYTVKNKMVKLDQFGKKSGNVEGSFVFDLEKSNIRWVNPKRKLWGDHKSETPVVIKGKCEVTKGAGTKTVQGVKCHEYTVKNTDENTVITYWITNDNFDFFLPLVKMLNRKDKQNVYFNQITGLPEGAMPFLSEERTISDNKLITRLEVVKVTKKTPDDASVSVPADYTKFDK